MTGSQPAVLHEKLHLDINGDSDVTNYFNDIFAPIDGYPSYDEVKVSGLMLHAIASELH